MNTNKFFILSFFLILPFTPSFTNPTLIINGTYEGDQIWDADTVKITGDVAINGSLTINPGTYVEYQGHYSLHAYKITALGTVCDSIIFTINDTTGFSDRSIPDGGWKAFGEINSSSEFRYCRISYAKVIESSPLFFTSYDMPSDLVIRFSNSIFKNNYSKGALFTLGWVAFKNTIIKGNVYKAFSASRILEVDSCLVTNNIGGFSSGWTYIKYTTFTKNTDLKLAGGLEYSINIYNSVFSDNYGLRLGSNDDMYPGSYLSLLNNRIVNNQNVFINSNLNNSGMLIGNLICNNLFLRGMQVGKMVSNTIVNNTTLNDDAIIVIFGIYEPIFWNTIIYKNRTSAGEKIQLGLDKDSENPDFLNCDIEGLNAIINPGRGGIIENNIDEDPLFVDTSNFDFRLSKNSPCINAGTPDTLGMHLPATDLAGNPRIVDFVIDMGAYEFIPEQVTIHEQPIGARLCPGDDYVLKTSASGKVVGYQWQRNGKNLSGENGDSLYFISVDTSKAGTYNCNIITTDSLVSTESVKIKVSPLPIINLGRDTVIHPNGEITLDAGNGFESYLWNTGTENQFLSVTSPVAGDFEYWVSVTDTNGCAASDTIRITVDLPNLIGDQLTAGNVKIYPNPTFGIVRLLFSADATKEIVIKVTDLSGRIMMEKNIGYVEGVPEYPMDLSSLDNGVYIIMVDRAVVRIVKNSNLK